MIQHPIGFKDMNGNEMFSNEELSKMRGYMADDKLQTMFEMQKALFERFRELENVDVENGDIHNKEFRQYYDYVYSKMIEEFYEAVMVFKYKKHNDNSQVFDREEYLEEMIDGWHFFMNLMILLNVTPDEFFNAYLKKNKKNHERIDRKLTAESNHKDYVIFGGGIAGLVAAYTAIQKGNTVLLVAEKLGGQIDLSKDGYTLGPRLLQCGHRSSKLLTDLGFDVSKIKKAKIGYLDQDYNLTSVPGNDFRAKYSEITRQSNEDVYSMSEGREIEYYDVEYSQLIEKLIVFLKAYDSSICDIIEDRKIISINTSREHRCFSIEFEPGKGGIISRKLGKVATINTMPVNVFSKVASVNIDFQSKVVMHDFYLAYLCNNEHFDFGDYDYIYSIKNPITRITKQNNNGDVVIEVLSDKNIDYSYNGGMIPGHLDILVRKKLATIPKIKDWLPENLIDIDAVGSRHNTVKTNPYDGYNIINDVWMLGRFAQLHRKVKLEQVLERIDNITNLETKYV